MSILERIRRTAAELDYMFEDVEEEKKATAAFSNIDLQVMYTIRAFDADGQELDLQADENRKLRQVIGSGVTSMSQRSGQNSLVDSFTGTLIHSINANIHKVSDGLYREDSLERRTRAIVDVDWLDNGVVAMNFHTTINSVLMSEEEAKSFGGAVRKAIDSYRGKGAPIVKNAVTSMYESALLEDDDLPEGVSFKVKFDHTEVINLSTEYGDRAVAAQRLAHLRPGKRPGCVKRVEESVREHRAEIAGFIDGLDLPGNASAADVADAIVAMVEEGADFDDLPKEIHDDVVHAYMAAKLGSRRNDEWT